MSLVLKLNTSTNLLNMNNIEGLLISHKNHDYKYSLYHLLEVILFAYPRCHMGQLNQEVIRVEVK